MKHVAYAIAVFYLVWKAILWCIWDTLLVTANRAPVKSRSLQELVALMAAASPKPGQPTPYTGDRFGGALDSYTNPKRFEAALTSSDPVAACQGLRIDCDDVAVLAAKTLSGHPDVESVKVVSMVDRWITGSHVICVGKQKNGRHFTFDTNGLIFHDQGDNDYLMNYFGYLTKTRYVTAVETEAWFLL